MVRGAACGRKHPRVLHNTGSALGVKQTFGWVDLFSWDWLADTYPETGGLVLFAQGGHGGGGVTFELCIGPRPDPETTADCDDTRGPETVQLSFTHRSVPEPGTLALLGAGLLGLFMRRKAD